MSSDRVRTLTPADEPQAVHTIVLAFAADPVARWSLPNAHQYIQTMPHITRAFGGRAFAHGSAFCSGDVVGAALWLPPGVQPDDAALTALMEQAVAPTIRGEVFGMFEEMAKYHPAEPHWYLPLIGVDPAHQGNGHGDALMAYALERCDREHLPAYLESSNPRNISLYRRHGFEPVGTIQVGSSPTMVPMLREAK